MPSLDLCFSKKNNRRLSVCKRAYARVGTHCVRTYAKLAYACAYVRAHARTHAYVNGTFGLSPIDNKNDLGDKQYARLANSSCQLENIL